MDATSVSSRGEESLCIFVVDDNEDAAVMLAELLSLVGYRVHAFHSGRDAVEAATDLQPAAAILDIGMPVMDGIEVAKHLRQVSSHTFLIACTAWGAPADLARTSAAGFDRHLVKPVDFDQVMRVLEDVPEQARSQRRC